MLEAQERFLCRPAGESARPIGGDARIEHAERVMLRTREGGVIVQAIERRADGTFTGVIYGVTPAHRGVARGERVHFTEAHVFAFKAQAAAGAAPDRDFSEMVRAFEQQLSRIEAEAAPEKPDPQDIDIEFAPPTIEAPQLAPTPVSPPDEVASSRAQGTNAGDADVEEAVRLLQARERRAPDFSAARERSRAPAPPIAESAGEQVSMVCVECGAPIDFRRSAGAAQKIGCPGCGRINDVTRAADAPRPAA